MRFAVLLHTAVACICVACSNDDVRPTVTGAPDAVSSTPSTTFECPVTPPNGVRPDGRHTNSNHHGNGGLTTALWPENIITVRRSEQRDKTPGGAVSMKFPWWLPAQDAELVIEGRRLDRPAPPLTASIPEGYSGTFQASGLNFPTTGCWEVTAHSAGATLQFVPLVLETP